MADIGSVLGGRYRLIELLGQGGMATIYRARDQQLERDVAVKVLRPEYGRDPDFGSRFRQEAQSAASLNHPNIVSVFDYGQDPVGPFIVMELVDGEDLSQIIKRSAPLGPRQAARLTAEVAHALSAAHERGIVHRDVKPGNVLVSRDGRVKVADFGIARAIAEAQMTLPGTTLGSVHYFSPEQARGEPATTASDVYALGIVLYELLTGRRPWVGDSAASIAMARLSGPIPSPSAVRAGIPPELESITRRALALAPEDRFDNAQAMAAALDGYLGDRPVDTPGVAPVVPPARPDPGRPTDATAVTVAAGVARPNAGRVPYSPEAYAEGDVPPPRPVGAGRRAPVYERVEEDERQGTSPWVWISALLALAILAVAAFLVFQLLSGGGSPEPSPSGQTVEVPNFVGMTFDEAQREGDRLGIEVVRAATEESDEPADTVLAQDPPEGTEIAEGDEVRLTLAVGAATVAVPDLRNRTRSEAINLIFQANLTLGDITEEYDPVVAEGLVIRQDPPANLQITKGAPINITISRGPEPTPTPTPEPTPTPTPVPTPVPTPPPTPPPTPTPTPVPPPSEEPPPS